MGAGILTALKLDGGIIIIILILFLITFIIFLIHHPGHPY